MDEPFVSTKLPTAAPEEASVADAVVVVVMEDEVATVVAAAATVAAATAVLPKALDMAPRTRTLLRPSSTDVGTPRASPVTVLVRKVSQSHQHAHHHETNRA